jgi:PAS domain-containing protein
MLLPEHRQHEYAWISRQLEQGEAVYDLHTQRRHKAGHLLPVSLTVVARRDRHGKLVGGEAAARMRGEAELVRQMTQEASNFAHLFARTPMPMCITRLTDGTVLAVNPSFREFTGQPEAALVGHRTVEMGLWRRRRAHRAAGAPAPPRPGAERPADGDAGRWQRPATCW